MQALGVVHDTPDRTLLSAPAGTGTGSGVQAPPVQSSASAVCAPELPLDEDPTAMHVVSDGHETLLRDPFPAGVGVG